MTANDQTWTVKSILDWCEGYLAQKGDAQPRHSAQYLLGETMGLSRIELYTNLDKPLTEEERATMREWVARRGKGEPLQLICGTAPFRYMVLEVAPGVLIPRPETEVLVSEVLALFLPPKPMSAYAFEDEPHPEAREERSTEAAIPVIDLSGDDSAEAVSGDGSDLRVFDGDVLDDRPQTLRVIDLCTGSGCIACALATEHPSMEVLALDIAPEALALAQKNVAAQGVADRVTVLESDLLSALVTDPENIGSFDAIVSNPPYIPSNVVDTLDAEVGEFEPRLALDGGADGLDLFRRLIDDAYDLLKPGGVLAVELFEDSLEEACAIAQSAGFNETRIVQDLTNRPRTLIAAK